MEYIIVIVVIVAAVAAAYNTSKQSEKTGNTGKKPATYNYLVKSRIMTEREIVFYEKLNKVAGVKYAVIPQVHLSAFLDHKIKGQNWKGAFSVINGKSVDYLLVDKSSQRPAIAIELDDYTHQSNTRIERDRKVEDIMQASGMRLVRFSDVNATEEQIFSRLAQQ